MTIVEWFIVAEAASGVALVVWLLWLNRGA